MVSYFRSTYLVKNVGVKTNGFPVELRPTAFKFRMHAMILQYEIHTHRKS